MMSSLQGRVSIFVFSLINLSWAFATEPASSPSPDQPYTNYFTIDDTRLLAGFAGPIALVSEISNQIQTDLNLTAWSHHDSPLNLPPEKYDRVKHFGTWVVDHSLGGCQNTRARVLMRTSKVPVDFSTNGCTVTAGEWDEPYVGYTTKSAADLQIDHVVPLKHAYTNGAYKWDYLHRCVYGNFMANDFHLLAVDGRSNMQKGDNSPVKWLPSQADFQCDYLKDWLSIKLIWGLAINPDEAKTLKELVVAKNCDLKDFQFSRQELASERRSIEAKLNICIKAQK